jgi:phage shock protein C
MASKRLYRSRNEKMVAGVCGGLADYLDIDPTIIRIIWVVVTLMGGAGLLAYLVMWIVVPLEPEATAPESPSPPIS